MPTLKVRNWAIKNAHQYFVVFHIMVGKIFQKFVFRINDTYWILAVLPYYPVADLQMPPFPVPLTLNLFTEANVNIHINNN